MSRMSGARCPCRRCRFSGCRPILRYVITPVVSGVAIMLVAVTVMMIAVGKLGEMPAGVPPGAGLAGTQPDAGR